VGATVRNAAAVVAVGLAMLALGAVLAADSGRITRRAVAHVGLLPAGAQLIAAASNAPVGEYVGLGDD